MWYYHIRKIFTTDKIMHEIKKRNMLQLAEYQKELRLHPQLTYLFFELTDCCNLNCLHCGSGCSAKNRKYQDFKLIKKTLEEVASKYDPTKIMICTSGGEPLLYPKLSEVISLAHSLHFRNGITSNGILITEQKAYELIKAGLNTAAISIDGLMDSHEQLRNTKGCFNKALEGVYNLRKFGIAPQAVSVIHKNNIHELQDIYNFLSSENFTSWRLVNIEPIGRTNENKQLLLSANELKTMLQFIQKKRFDSKNSMDVTFGCSHFLTYEFEHNVRDFYFQCGAGTKVASILVNGDIAACLDIERRAELIQGNVSKDSFIDVWEDKFEIFRNDRTINSRNCGNCEYRTVCQGDSMHTWDFENQEPNYCFVKLMEEENL